jgi:DNA polymerase-3 subunit epsilon
LNKEAERQDEPAAATRSLRQAGRLWLLVLSGVLLGVLTALLMVSIGPAALPRHGLLVFSGLAAFLGIAACWRLWMLLMLHLRGLERLRGALIGRRGIGDALPPMTRSEAGGLELHRLQLMIEEALEVSDQALSLPQEQLKAVLASLHQAVVVITDQGFISLVNGAAKNLLGAEHLRIGTSIFDVFQRHSLLRSLDEATGAGVPIAADLMAVDGATLAATVTGFERFGGAILTFAGAEGFSAVIDLDFDLHEQPPPPVTPLGPDCPLAQLPIAVLDCETTGLEVKRDRIVSIGAVRLQGRHLYHHIVLDHLVDPGQRIPRRSTAIHGITDEMVAGQASFAVVFPEVRSFLDGCVLLGHNVPFDAAMLKRECSLAEIDWQPPPVLDLLRLSVALDPKLSSYSLDSLAAWLGVEIRGRHTALGDSLVTAEIYQLLLPRLIDAGVTTLAEAQQFELKAQVIIKQQTALGWW